ncbi:MAG: ribonucleotide-diphosphate reductase subunit alpha, partial [Pseudomonas sp.]|nr:ribonucleotide-diphosphate reductase subunit alpha [Pseudomonas sp.]
AIFEGIKKDAVESSYQIANEKGAAPDLEGSDVPRRNAHLLAIAPNANSSMIAGSSPSIEPWKSNAYVHNTRAGTHTVRNYYLKEELAEHGLDTPETWRSIVANDGSIAHLALPESVKAIFKTALEIDQRWIIRHAADRQPFICQGQSVNLFFPAGVLRAYVNEVHLMAWREGLKGLYYYRTESAAKADKLGVQLERVALGDAPSAEECTACHA